MVVSAAFNPLSRNFPQTIPDFLRLRVQESPHAIACCHYVEGKGWMTTDWSHYWQEVQQAAFALKRFGLRTGDRLGIMIPTSKEWDLLEKAALLLGAVVVGIEPHASVEHREFIIGHSQAKALFVKDTEQLRDLKDESIHSLQFVITLADRSQEEGIAVLAWRDIQNETPVVEDLAGANPTGSDPATLIFTSGTTGTPKGILYTHRQCMLACQSLLEIFGTFGSENRVICWLPLANLFQRMLNLFAVGTGSAIYFVEDPRRVLDYMQLVRPSIFIGVPRFYEKLYNGIQTRIANMPAWQKRLVLAALGVADRHAQLRREHKPLPLSLQVLFAAADKLVLSRLCQVMGGKIKYMITGSAPCPLQVLTFFDAIHLPLLEAYGMSENIIPLAINRPHEYRLGSVGKPLALNEVKIADDGEVLVKGPGVFSGYYQSEQPCEGFTADGFYASGDYGYFDNEGYLYLKGRKSEIIKTSTGRRLSLTRVEHVLRQSTLVDQAVVIGSGRKTLCALITLDPERLAGLRRLATAEIEKISEPGPLSSVAKQLAGDIQRQQQTLAPYERINGCILLTGPLTVEGGELTPNLKLRRAFIETKYKAAIDHLYEILEQSRRSESAAPAEEPIVLCL